MLKILLLATFIHNLTFVLSFLNSCSLDEDISPCKCEYSSYDFHDNRGTGIECPNVSSIDELKKAFANLKGIKKVSITFDNAKFDEIPSDLFKGLDVVDLAFYSGALKRIGEEGKASFEGLENTLKVFGIYNNADKEDGLVYLNMSSLNVVHTLAIYRSKMPILGNECFKNGPENQLIRLTLDACSIEVIGDKVFEKLVNLRFLTLEGNRLRYLRRSMFPSPALYLEELQLSSNGISSLPEDLFSDMPSLRYVDLSKNDISNLPEGIFSDMPALKTLHLTGNHIARLNEATWSPIWSDLELLMIKENPLECDSHIEWTFRYRMPERLFAVCQTTEYKFHDLSEIISKKQRRCRTCFED